MRKLEVRSLHDLDKNVLNTIRRSSENEDGMFNDCQCSDREVDDIDSIDSERSLNDFDDISIDSDDPYNCEFNLPVDQYFLFFIVISIY